MRQLNKSQINKILVISLSNIGDVVLTFPVVDILIDHFPDAKISMVVGPNAESLVQGDSAISKLFIYNKHQSGPQKFKWVSQLRREKFDLVVDLRNSAIPFMIFPKYRTSIFVKKILNQHMRDKHLDRLKSVFDFKDNVSKQHLLSLSDDLQRKCDQILDMQNAKYVVMAPGSNNHKKRWLQEGFAKVADHLYEKHKLPTIFIGDHTDKQLTQSIIDQMKSDADNLCGRTNLAQSAAIIRRACLVITNDSASMHIASYLNMPTLALFGDSSPLKYGPWSSNSIYLEGDGGPESILSIKAEDVINKIRIEKDQVSFKQ